jgi:hypothetical protein
MDYHGLYLQIPQPKHNGASPVVAGSAVKFAIKNFLVKLQVT